MRNKLPKILAQVILFICCFGIFEKQVFSDGEIVDFGPDNLYILSVGIDEYENDKIRLKLAKNDAQAIADEFEKRGKYKYKKIEKIVLLDKNATRVNILSQLESIAKKATESDVFIFSYSGWGNSFVDEFYLYPFDSKDNSNKALETNISN